MKKLLTRILILLFIFTLNISAQDKFFDLDVPLFDKGPDPKNPMHRELLEILNELPNVPGLSEELEVLAPVYKRGQKFRPNFGAMILRGLLEENSIQALVIGQDATHIAEAANRPGIAGFGGRVQDMLKHMGIKDGVLFTNLFVNTISGQYGSRNTPVLQADGTIKYVNVIENRQWLLAHDSAYSKWRNKLYSWIIRNNKDSLKVVTLLGQAGKDAGANFVNSLNGATVTAHSRVGTGSQYKVPLFEMVAAGGNNEWAVPVTKDGKDVAEILRKDDEIRGKLEKKLKGYLQKETDNFEAIISKSSKQADAKIIISDLEETYQWTARENLKKKLKRLDSKIYSAWEKADVLDSRLKALSKGIDYKDATETALISAANAQDLLQDNPKTAEELMVFSYGGPERNGVLVPEQFGGYDLNTMKVNGKDTRTIKGLKIPYEDNGVTKYFDAPNLVFTGSPHPTSLSMTTPDKASELAEDQLFKPLKQAMKDGWVAPLPEKGMTSPFLEGKKYKYGRASIPRSHGDLGIPDTRLMPVSEASRDGKDGIIIGTRQKATFDSVKAKKMRVDVASNIALMESNYVLTGRPKDPTMSMIYDRGPNDEYSKLLLTTMDKQEVLMPHARYEAEARKMIQDEHIKIQKQEIAAAKKRGENISKYFLSPEDIEDSYQKVMAKIFDKYGIDAFPSKSAPEVGLYGHYRGTFDKPKVIVLADPHGYDSIISARAYSGERGQFFNGIMDDLEINEKYLVINTVPFGMDDATPDDWKVSLERTSEYRKKLFAKLVKDNPNAIFVADGQQASKELEKLVSGKKVISISRGKDADSGIKEAGKEIQLLKSEWANRKISGKRVDIPREHITWIGRTWEGTSGDKVITAKGKFRGKAFLVVHPKWAIDNNVNFSDIEKTEMDIALKKLKYNNEPLPNESVEKYLIRMEEERINIIPKDCNTHVR